MSIVQPPKDRKPFLTCLDLLPRGCRFRLAFYHHLGFSADRLCQQAVNLLPGEYSYHRCQLPRLQKTLAAGQVQRRVRVKAGTKWALPHFWCNPAADWRNPLESREPLCDRFAWGFSVCGDFFEASGWSFAVRSFRRHTLPSPSRARRSVHRVLRAAVSPAAGTAAIPGS